MERELLNTVHSFLCIMRWLSESRDFRRIWHWSLINILKARLWKQDCCHVAFQLDKHEKENKLIQLGANMYTLLKSHFYCPVRARKEEGRNICAFGISVNI